MSLHAEEVKPSQDLESELSIFNGYFPDKAVSYAVNNQQESIPILLAFLKEAIKKGTTLNEQYMGHLYALYILSQLKEKKAYPLVLEICKLSYEKQDFLLGDNLTESLAQFIGSTFDGDLASLKELIESSSTHYYARAQCLSALLVLLNDGIIESRDIYSYVPSLFEMFIQNKDLAGMTNLVNFCIEFEVSPFLDDIKQAFDLGLVDLQVVNLQDVLYLGKNKQHSRYKTDPHYQSIKDATQEMSWWACFQEDEDKEMFFEHTHQHSGDCGCNNTTFKHTIPKLGRNDPCHCGSGKKYKKCCLN